MLVKMASEVLGTDLGQPLFIQFSEEIKHELGALLIEKRNLFNKF